MVKAPRAVVLTGFGINCEKELALACKLAGASVSFLHTQEALRYPEKLLQYDWLLLAGGFTFADELGAAQVFANRIKWKKNAEGISLYEIFTRFISEGKCILGICNGFQTLVKLGLIPGGAIKSALLQNDSGKFEDRWCYHSVLPTHSIYTKGLERLFLPIRHAEGKCIFLKDCDTGYLIEKGQVVFRYTNEKGDPTMEYPWNPNGSDGSIAALCDETGRILGMMAHPEAACYFTNHPNWVAIKENLIRKGVKLPEKGEGLILFENCVQYLKENR